ncbi:serine/threonine-protein kinase [Streptomyces globosus]|uniref:serine/threonine-protein kinase n=1 Tax=Streptomyces globosus TaxID=68209 RepID=UPI003827AB24
MREIIQGRYELTARLGKGGMAEVWEADDLRLGRRVAVKFLKAPAGGRDLDRLERRFEREARLTARMGHPSVPVVHETGRHTDGGLYIVMELVDGQTLSARLKNDGPLPVPLAATIAVQTADVLAHAHRIGVVHRDLKPSNLMLTANDTLKVLDFGIAAALEPDPDEPRLTRTSDVMGTPGFISPEQGEGRPATARSDLYALGCVLYEIAAGRPPFTVAPGAQPLYLVFRHVHETPRPVSEHRPDLPADFAVLVMRLLAKDPAARPSPQEVQDLARTWMAAPSKATPTTPPAPRPTGFATGTGHPPPATLSRQADALAARGDHAGAATLIEDYLHRTLLPLDDSEALPLRLTLCELLLQSEDFTGAYDHYFALGGALRRNRPATDRDVLACRAGAARCLSELGRTPEALHEFEALLPVQQHVFGPVDRTVFDTRYEIAVLIARGGGIQAARDQLTSLVEDQQRVLPNGDERHPRASALLSRLNRILNAG